MEAGARGDENVSENRLIIPKGFMVHRGFVGNGKGNQSFQLWPHIANMSPLGSQCMPDQDGLVTIDSPFPTNPR